MTNQMTETELIKKYTRYIHTVPFSLRSPDNFDDLIQEGRIAVIRSLQTHNPEKGDLQSHIINRIKYDMMRWLSNHSRTIRVPISTQSNKEKPWEEIPMVSGDRLIYEEGETTIFDEVEADYYINDYETEDAASAVTNKLMWAISQLKHKPAKAVHLHYFGNRTVAQIADEMNTSKQLIEHYLKKSLPILKKLLTIEK